MQSHEQRNKMRWIMFIVFLGIFGATAAATIWSAYFGKNPASASDQALLIRSFLIEVAVAVVALFYELFHLPKKNQSGADGAHATSSFFVKSYSQSQHPEFFKEAERLLATATQVILIANGLNLLWERHILDAVVQAVRSGRLELTVCMGNTRSPAVRSRLIEEHMGINRPAVSASGVDRNVRMLVERLRVEQISENVNIKLFDNYPTFATLMFDQEIFVYPYGYQTLGNSSPLFHFRNDGSPEAQFFVNNAKAILRDASPAGGVVAARRSKRYTSEEWVQAAVYAIPESTSAFYQTASSILGYDILSNVAISVTAQSRRLRKFAGEAASFGLHATLADALNFTSDGQIDRLKAELTYLSEEFQPFQFEDFSIGVSPQDDRAVVAVARERLGVVEAIHHELVSRMYSLAISSGFTTGKTSKPVPSGDQRTSLMMAHYGSPYILNEMFPHFTLLSALPLDPDTRAAILDETRLILEPALADPISISELTLVIKRRGEKYWSVEKSFPLCGPRGGD